MCILGIIIFERMTTVEKYITALRKQYPNANIETQVHIQDGCVAMEASIKDGERRVATAFRVYPCPVGSNAVDALEAVKDAITLAGISPSQIAGGENPDEADPKPVPKGDVAPSVGPTAQVSAPAEKAEAETGVDGVSSSGKVEASVEPSVRPRARRKKAEKPPAPSEPSFDDLDKARAVKLAFASADAEAKAPIHMRRHTGVPLGTIADAYPHFVRYLTQPAGKQYVTDEVTTAAEIIMRSMG